MDDLDTKVATVLDKAEGCARWAGTSKAHQAEDNKAFQASMSTWSKVLTNGWITRPLLLLASLAVMMGGWVWLIHMQAFVSESSDWWALPCVVWGLLNFFGLAITIGTVADGNFTNHVRRTVGKPKGSWTMRYLRYQALTRASDIRWIWGREISRKELRLKLKEAAEVTKVEQKALDILQAILISLETTCEAEELVHAATKSMDECDWIPVEEDRERAKACVRTILSCRTEAARLVVALEAVHQAEESKVKSRKENREAKKTLALIEQKRVFLAKEQDTLVNVPLIATRGLFDHAQDVSAQVLAEQEVTSEIKRLAER